MNMRFIISTLLLLLSLQLMAFEGVIKVNYKQFNGTNDKFTFTWKFKGDKCALQMDLIGDVKNSSVFIPELANKRFLTYNLNVTDKIFYTIPLSDISGSTNNYSMQSTTEKKTIAGQECLKYNFSSDGGSLEVWVAPSISIDWKVYAPFFKTSEDIQALASNGINGFPMEVVVKNQQGIIIQSSTTTSVSNSKIEDASFNVPSGYTSQQLDNK